MLPVSNVLEKAINDGELEIPEHRQTHKSHEEFLACDICQDWERRAMRFWRKPWVPASQTSANPCAWDVKKS